MKKNEDIRLLYIDLFCGAGGTSTGVENARIGDRKIAKVVACVNHDANAIASHNANHPDAIHYTEDIRTLDLAPMVRHIDLARKTHPGALVVLWASLECTNFSRAKGGMSRDADSRTLAEHLFRYVEAIRPDIIQIENVDEFQTWGPLIEKRKADGSVIMVRKSEGKGKDRKVWTEPAMIPDPEHKGQYYERWVRNMCSYGYTFASRILNSADYGAYTSRKRFFGMFVRKGIPMVFPEPTHAKHPDNNLFGDSRQPWKAVKDVLDLQDEGQSIFDRKKPLVEATLKRILAGLRKFVSPAQQDFMVKYNSMSRSGKYIPPDINDPCPVVATQGRLSIAKTHFLTKAYSGEPEGKLSDIDSPSGAVTTRDHHQFITTYYGHGGFHTTDRPAPTLTTKDRIALVFLDNQYGNGTPSSLLDPSPTITNNPKAHPIGVQFITNTYSFKSDGSSVDAPSPTVIARQDKAPLGLATVKPQSAKLPSFIRETPQGIEYIIYPEDNKTLREIKEFMCRHGIVDITMRMLHIKELKLIQGFPEDYVLCGTQEEQKKYLGNAVVTIMAKVWCEAIVQAIGGVPNAKVA